MFKLLEILLIVKLYAHNNIFAFWLIAKVHIRKIKQLLTVLLTNWSHVFSTDFSKSLSVYKMTNTSEMASFLESCWGKLKHILIKWIRSFWDTRRFINFCIFSYGKYVRVSLNWNLTAILIEPVSPRLLPDKWRDAISFFVIFCHGFLRNIAF